MDLATKRQIQASIPYQSTWLSANAGSGKTRVLTDRVVRLLLAGTDPQNILCLTYTNAAANEMQNRLFQRLGSWAMLSDKDLRAELQKLGDNRSSQDELRQARRLFAMAIETPGGLKIQTIHSFCAALLRRFPLEAGVSPQFVEIDEQAAKELRSKILDYIADGPDAPVLNALAQLVSEQSLYELIEEISKLANQFEGSFNEAKFASALGGIAISPKELIAEAFDKQSYDLLVRLIQTLRNGSSTDQKAARKLQTIQKLDYASLTIFESVFLTGERAKEPFTAKVGSFPTKETRENLITDMDALNDWMIRIQETRPKRLIAETVKHSETLYAFAKIYTDHYRTEKQRYGWLDFDDLIGKTHDLLSDAAVAPWVLYKLDGQIDHVLVDEAQDTSPAQWNVIRALINDITSGQSARDDIVRTLFVVGDKKQSIYSFQGANAAEFDAVHNDLTANFQQVQQELTQQDLRHSFRSSNAILSVVDRTFAKINAPWFDTDHDHIAYHADLPGRVDLWPIYETAEEAKDPPWYSPVDIRTDTDPVVVLAHDIANQIKTLCDGQHPIPDADLVVRPIRPGDFLILVQRRTTPVFHEVIKALKAHGLDVSGPDRVVLTEELAVKDIISLLRFLSTPEDDLSLAEALKSPMFSWDDPKLFKYANGRGGKYLWQVIRDLRSEIPETFAVLTDLRDHVDFVRPYELIERILTHHDGRRKLLGRLGVESEDGINLLLTQAMDYEARSSGSLTGFLSWLDSDDVIIKRQPDSAGDQIRIMTAHGAKGLEAPIVILPDTGSRQIRLRQKLLDMGKHVFWNTSSTQSPDRLTEKKVALIQAEQAERDRLLYVAMTRAEKWLIVTGAGKADEASWYEKVRHGLQASEAMTWDFVNGAGLRYEHMEWPQVVPNVENTLEDATPILEDFYMDLAPAVSSPEKPLSPSNLGGPKALLSELGGDATTAALRGQKIHVLIEYLPKYPRDQWINQSMNLLGRFGPATDQDNTAIYKETCQVLDANELAFLFENNALAEVPICANLPDFAGQSFYGVIDRLIVGETIIRAIDFKSNRAVPDTFDQVPNGLLRQMGAYAHMLKQVYPDHQIETGLVWTKTAELMMLPHDLVTDALMNTDIS